jgi:hypothetical protein
MVSIASEVRRIISERPFLEEALARGIINYNNLAKELEMELSENPLLKDQKIKQSAIMMALRRLAKDLNREFSRLNTIAGNAPNVKLFSSIYGLIEITIERSPTSLEKIRDLYDIVNLQKGDFLTITQGIYELTIIVNEEYEDMITDLLGQDNVVQVNKELASLSLKIPESAIDEEGLFYSVTKALYWADINIVEIVSTFTEMTFILKEIDIPAATKTIKSLTTRD